MPILSSEEPQISSMGKEKKTLLIAFTLNFSMFLIGIIAGILAQSTSLMADSLDMLADAFAYSIGLIAIGRSHAFKAKAAKLSGILLLLLGIWILIEVIRRAIAGSFPDSTTIIAIATISLIVNTIVLRMLRKFKKGEAHLQASWIFTRADVIANIGVIIAGILVAITHSRYPDLIVGFAIGIYVIKEAFEIIGLARD